MRLFTRIVLLALVPIVLVGGLTVFALRIIETQKDDGLVINLAGRRRMPSQKMTKELLMLSRARAEGRPSGTAPARR